MYGDVENCGKFKKKNCGSITKENNQSVPVNKYSRPKDSKQLPSLRLRVQQVHKFLLLVHKRLKKLEKYLQKCNKI